MGTPGRDDGAIVTAAPDDAGLRARFDDHPKVQYELHLAGTLVRANAAETDGALPARHVGVTADDGGAHAHTEVLDRIFEPSFTTKPRRQGTGFNPSSSLAFVTSHGGFGRGEPGEGTTFRLYLSTAESGLAGNGLTAAKYANVGTFLSRPYTAEDLVAALREALDRTG